MRRVFVDTVGFLALWNNQDPWHARAAPVFQQLITEAADLYTSVYILLECGNAASRSRFRSDVVEVRRQFELEGKLIDPANEDCRRAWEAYERGRAGDAGIVDYVSFEVMRRLGITDAFTNDKHFRIAGFNTLF